MPDAMIDIMTSLTDIMNEESALLRSRDRASALGELAAAKARLVGQLEEALARQMDRATGRRGAGTAEAIGFGHA
jgi:flagellar biosynthesis/type III secretory pathway chaperone